MMDVSALLLLGTLILGATKVLAIPEGVKEISATLGATVHIPDNVPCIKRLHMTFDLDRSGQNSGFVGSYEDDLLSDDKYKGRLDFSKKSCSFILRNVTTADTGTYTYVQQMSSDGKNKNTTKININLTITAPETTTPSKLSVKSGDLQASGLLGRFVALCLAVVSLGHFLINLLPWMDAKSLESRCCCPCLRNGISGTIPRIQQSLRTALGYTGLLFLMGQIISITLWLYYGYKSVFDWTLLGAVALNTGICIMGICSGAITPPCPKAVCPLSDMLQKIEWLSVAYTSISKFIMLGYSISLLVLYCLSSDNGKVENWILILIIIIILGLLIDVVTCVCIYRGCRQDPSPAVTKAEGEILPEMEQLNPPGAMDGGPVGIVAVLC